MRILGQATLVGSLTSACLIPPDRVLIEERVNSAPELDLPTIDPPQLILEVPYDCRRFRVRANVIDKNDTDLMYRLVAFDGTRQRESDAGSITVDEAGEPGIIRGRVTPGSDYPLLVEKADVSVNTDAEAQIGVLSLFVTDAPQWLVPPDEVDVTESGLGEIVNPEVEGFPPYSVTEVRWTVLIEPEATLGNSEDCLK
ncbi:MAG: hypothetical protein RMA76_23380 [Deltaproteobacteria bacterium]